MLGQSTPVHRPVQLVHVRSTGCIGPEAPSDAGGPAGPSGPRSESRPAGRHGIGLRPRVGRGLSGSVQGDLCRRDTISLSVWTGVDWLDWPRRTRALGRYTRPPTELGMAYVEATVTRYLTAASRCARITVLAMEPTHLNHHWRRP